MRPLTPHEQNNVKILTENQISCALIEPTQTGLNKSILDATGLIRGFLKQNLIHDYDFQGQGPENKIQLDALIYEEFAVSKSITSLYRPLTKSGDPRIWFSGLSKITRPNDILAIIYYQTSFHVLNLTSLDIQQLLMSTIVSPIKELILEISAKTNEVANELLAMLRIIAQTGPIKSVVEADTSVGRTLEKSLGIDINSSKKPDYKGIEIKSFRRSKTNRKNLFAQVPDWDISKFKSSSDILDAFGYQRGADFKLYCTVSSLNSNSQGLSLKMDTDIKQLIENSDKPEIGDFVVWRLTTLHKRLLEKHRETFWVEATSTFIEGIEHFQYTLVDHTKSPIISQFDILLEQGFITLDHLIKRNLKGKVIEKGPIFKIKPQGIDLLFPPSSKYTLI
jgi:hypothetical protein